MMSISKSEGFYTYEQIMRAKFEGYSVDEKLSLKPPSTMQYTMEKVKKILLSKDLSSEEVSKFD